MKNMTVFILGIAILSAGTYLMRLGGRNSVAGWRFLNGLQALLSDAATVLLFSVAGNNVLWRDHFAGDGARTGWGWAVCFLAQKCR